MKQIPLRLDEGKIKQAVSWNKANNKHPVNKAAILCKLISISDGNKEMNAAEIHYM